MKLELKPMYTVLVKNRYMFMGLVETLNLASMMSNVNGAHCVNI